jgi:hypothetical protein
VTGSILDCEVKLCGQCDYRPPTVPQGLPLKQGHWALRAADMDTVGSWVTLGHSAQQPLILKAETVSETLDINYIVTVLIF